MKNIPFPAHPVLIVDDEQPILHSLSGALKSKGINNIITCHDSRQVMEILSKEKIYVLLLDLTMPYLSGQELLSGIREKYPEIQVIIITGATEVTTAVDCMKMGVFDYLVKAVEKNKLLSTVSRAIEIRELKQENISLRERLMDRALEHPEVFQGIAAWDEKMQSTLMYIEAIAPTSQTVLITGETGVGKELIAEAIHSLSHRQGEYVAVNIAGLDDSMFTDTLFGHIAGAYTGADKTRQGLIERAAGGTLFLDEIGDLSPASQIRLLRLLETREYYPLGSDLAKRTDARILVSTNKDLKQEMREGRFRRDLYYRLKTHPVHIPSLRERSADLPQLIDTFIRQAAEEFGREIPAVPPSLYGLLKSYHFPGNIRELKSLIFDAISRQTSKSLDLSVFEEAVGEKEGSRTSNGNGAYFSNTEKLPTIKQATDSLIAEALSRANGNQSQAARMLGISPQALSKRLKGPKD